jgi:diguanylate cyclase (GGDEF)-like protein
LATVVTIGADVPDPIGATPKYLRFTHRSAGVPYTSVRPGNPRDEDTKTTGTGRGSNDAVDERLDGIRALLTFALLLEFVVLAALVTIGPALSAPGGWSLPPLGHLLVGGVAMAAVAAWAGRAVLARVRELDEERRRLVDLYGRARSDALLDALTGLGNHRAFQEELAHRLELSALDDDPLALLLIDVDDLKKVNDELGHASGDQLLAAVGRVASSVLRRSDKAFRIGGDEFAVILPHSTIDDALTAGRRMLASALGGGDPSQPVAPFSLSIGASSWPAPSDLPGSLYRHADAALYWCKRHGRTAVVAFDPGRHGGGGDGRSISELSTAVGQLLSSRALTPAYQPIFSLVTGQPVGFEGLVRVDPAGPFRDAGSLFAAGEAADRTVELDRLCIEIVAAGAGRIEPGQYLSVNLSPRTLESDLFRPMEISLLLRRWGIAPDQVVLELTERESVQDLDQLRRNAMACRQAGFRLAADDVGAGNAGLRLLSEIHFDIVKVDLSLVQGGILHDPSHGVLLALRELASQWRATIVAEGVETGHQLRVIRQLGIAAAQGYLLGRPTRSRVAQRLDLDVLAATPDELLEEAAVA